jgi:hypothetical protein
VNVVLTSIWKVIVDHQGNVGDINTAGSYICGHEDTVEAALKAIQSVTTLTKRTV